MNKVERCCVMGCRSSVYVETEEDFEVWCFSQDSPDLRIHFTVCKYHWNMLNERSNQLFELTTVNQPPEGGYG